MDSYLGASLDFLKAVSLIVNINIHLKKKWCESSWWIPQGQDGTEMTYTLYRS